MALVPEHAPPQPLKTDPVAGDAVSVTLRPNGKSSVQSAPQLMPLGVDVTVPVPLPARATRSVRVCRVNVATTLRAAVMLTVQVGDVPEHAPDQPVKSTPTAARALSVTEVPWA